MGISWPVTDPITGIVTGRESRFHISSINNGIRDRSRFPFSGLESRFGPTCCIWVTNPILSYLVLTCRSSRGEQMFPDGPILGVPCAKSCSTEQCNKAVLYNKRAWRPKIEEITVESHHLWTRWPNVEKLPKTCRKSQNMGTEATLEQGLLFRMALV